MRHILASLTVGWILLGALVPTLSPLALALVALALFESGYRLLRAHAPAH